MAVPGSQSPRILASHWVPRFLVVRPDPSDVGVASWISLTSWCITWDSNFEGYLNRDYGLNKLYKNQLIFGPSMWNFGDGEIVKSYIPTGGRCCSPNLTCSSTAQLSNQYGRPNRKHFPQKWMNIFETFWNLDLVDHCLTASHPTNIHKCLKPLT